MSTDALNAQVSELKKDLAEKQAELVKTESHSSCELDSVNLERNSLLDEISAAKLCTEEKDKVIENLQVQKIDLLQKIEKLEDRCKKSKLFRDLKNKASPKNSCIQSVFLPLERRKMLIL